MEETLTEQRRVGEEVFRDVKPFSLGRKKDGTRGISTGKLRASSRGNT
jgi:hypothetical protein